MNKIVREPTTTTHNEDLLQPQCTSGWGLSELASHYDYPLPPRWLVGLAITLLTHQDRNKIVTVMQTTPDSKARWAHGGPTWSRQDPRWANMGPTKSAVGDVFRFFFLFANCFIMIQISLIFVPRISINSKSARQHYSRCWPVIVQFTTRMLYCVSL